MSSSRPQNVGILGLEVYFPSQYVKQEDLEKHDGVAAGKYTIGLGQTQMAYVDDLEDTNSMALTVLSSLIKKYNIDTSKIGRLEVGTETLLDKSKSVKTVLMQLFGDNTDIEGIDTVNACYGGTNAVFNTVNWIESSSWDGRNAIVVAVDIALYAKGNARPTGGAGAVAMLIGPDAPIVFDPVHGSHIKHAYDFYKPDFTSEYPYVDGQYSLTCYTEALDKCYQTYNKKAANRIEFSQQGLDRFDYSVFHSPTCKLVSKCYARLLYNDFLADPSQFKDSVPEEIKKLDYQSSLTDKSVEKLFMGLVKQKAKERLNPSQLVPTNIGNMYAASVYSSFCSLIGTVPPSDLKGKRVSFFSYGSGLASSFFSVQIKGDVSDIQKKLNIAQRLTSRRASSPLEYEAAIELREKAYLQKGFKPKGDISALSPGTYYLTEVDEKFRRSYAVKN